jgi:hypothetical protein
VLIWLAILVLGKAPVFSLSLDGSANPSRRDGEQASFSLTAAN